ncbi:MAG: hypothetical protein ACI9ZD_002446 [Paracoccaceae bacterium]|jgi:hypothetical protein
MTTLFDQRPFGRKLEGGVQIIASCRKRLSVQNNASPQTQAISILNQYSALDDVQKAAFFSFLNDELEPGAAKKADCTT